MRDKLVYAILLVLCLAIAASSVSAYTFACYAGGEILPGGVVCSNTFCAACLTDSGYTTLPGNCPDFNLFCSASSHPPNPIPTNTTTCNCTDINHRLQALEMKVWQLESSIAAQNTTVSNLNTWVIDMQATITSIQNLITSVMTRLTALEAGTPGTNPGCTESWSCSSWSACQAGNIQTRTCTDANSCGSTVLRPAQTQSCAYDPRVVKFRTNVQGGNYNTASAELVFDNNNDGTLDCFKYMSFYSTYTNRLPTLLINTPEGYKVEKYYTSNSQVIIRYGSQPYFQLSTGCVTPTTKAPVEPYASTGRELYI